MKKVFEQPSVMLESLQANEAIMDVVGDGFEFGLWGISGTGDE